MIFINSTSMIDTNGVPHFKIVYENNPGKLRNLTYEVPVALTRVTFSYIQVGV